MKRYITLKLLNSLSPCPCYNPRKIGFTKDLELTPLQFIKQFKNKVKNKEDIIWVICRKEFMSDKDLRLFAVWCAREALSLADSPDTRSIEACNVAERYANGKATIKELNVAESDAWDATACDAWAATAAACDAWDTANDWAATAAARDASWNAAKAAAARAATAAACDAVRVVAWNAARESQIKQLETYFK